MKCFVVQLSLPYSPQFRLETRLIRIGRLDTNLPKANPYTRQIATLHGGEYNKVSPCHIEERIIGDIGAELRFRYIDCVLLELETMTPSVKGLLFVVFLSFFYSCQIKEADYVP